jgi:hypothetical protein
VILLSSSFTLWASLATALGAATPEDTFPQGPTRTEVLTWLAGHSDINPGAVVAMTDEVVVAITVRQDGRGLDGSTRLTLREEVINPDAAVAWGGRSMQLDLDLDCPRRRVMLGARRIYAKPNMQGSARITRPDTAWTEAPRDTVIDDVARAACAPQAPAQLAATQPAPVPKPAEVAAAPAASAPARPPAAVAQIAAAEPPSPRIVSFDPPATPAPARPQPAVAPPTAAPQPPPATVQIAAAEPPSPRIVSFDPPAAPAPAATAVTIAASSATSVIVIDSPPADQSVVVHNPFAPPEAQGRAAKDAPAPASRPPEFSVQIAAAASADLARDSWQALKAKLPDLVGPRTFAVEPVSANGRTLYRALLLGFSSPEEAAALCTELRSRSVDCILRPMR